MGNVHMEATQINYRGGGVKKSVEQAIKDATELTPEQKTNINKIPAIEAAVATKADQAIIAPEFDSEAGVYAIGDLVMYEGKLYEFTAAHETPGDWDSTEVTEKTVSDELDTLKSGLTNLIKKAESSRVGSRSAKIDELYSVFNTLTMKEKCNSFICDSGMISIMKYNTGGSYFDTIPYRDSDTHIKLVHIAIKSSGSEYGVYDFTDGTYTDLSLQSNDSIYCLYTYL